MSVSLRVFCGEVEVHQVAERVEFVGDAVAAARVARVCEF